MISFRFLARGASEEQNSKATYTKMDETPTPMCHKRTEIRSHDALPSRPIQSIKVLQLTAQ